MVIHILFKYIVFLIEGLDMSNTINLCVVINEELILVSRYW